MNCRALSWFNTRCWKRIVDRFRTKSHTHAHQTSYLWEKWTGDTQIKYQTEHSISTYSCPYLKKTSHFCSLDQINIKSIVFTNWINFGTIQFSLRKRRNYAWNFYIFMKVHRVVQNKNNNSDKCCSCENLI